MMERVRLPGSGPAAFRCINCRSRDRATRRNFPGRRRSIGRSIEFLPPKEDGMASKASAVWTGSLKEGKGTISTATGVLKDANYSFATRFEGAASGTTPEELIAAA